MSGNDQPPYPPGQPGPPPGEEPTRIGGSPGQPQNPYGPPPQGPYGAPPPPWGPPPGGPGGPDRLGAPFPPPKKGRKALLIGIGLLVVLLLAGGGVGAFLLLGKDDDTDDEPEIVAVDEWCASVQAAYDIPKSETDEDPSKVSDALRDAGVPEGISDEAKAGLEELIEIGDEAETGEDAKKAANDRATKGSDLAAFYTWMTGKCPDLTTQETVEVEEYCDAMDEAYELIYSAEDQPTGDPAEFADAIEEAGITEDMTEDQVAGREIVIRVIREADTYDDLDDVDSEFTAEETEQTDAFFEYYAENCTDYDSGTETEIPEPSESSTP